uniref:uncharacterized protein LOC122611031 n=1 Tax=Erigeron canadensis TaxID=72917 RepID=UPI001CB8DE50|nr:uncharacterized protein LOC122611031 [Erigeron canadensis]
MSGRKDNWGWIGGKNTSFSVKGVKDWLRGGINSNNRFVFSWFKWAPKKCNILMWRIGLERIPTMLALRDRKCRFNSLLCALCEKEEEEDVNHLFCYCEVSMEIWQKVSSWCGIQPIFLFTVKDLFEVHSNARLEKRSASGLQGIIFTTCWCLWLARNEKKFDNGKVHVEKIFQDVKTLGFLWYRNRTKFYSITWDDWCNFKLM